MRVGLVAALGAAVMLGGCATFVRGTDELLEINTEPPGATVSMTMTPFCDMECMQKNYPDQATRMQPGFDAPVRGPACQSTPCSVAVPRNKALTITAMREGFQPRSIIVRPQVGDGAVVTAGNAVVGGLTGVMIDGISGANFDHCPNPLNIKLRPLRSNEPEAPITGACASKPIHDTAATPVYR